MMDEEIVKEAKENKVSDYIQKTVDADELVTCWWMKFMDSYNRTILQYLRSYFGWNESYDKDSYCI